MMASFDFTVLKAAMEGSDGATLTGLYADDAEMTVIDRNHPPTNPLTLHGKPAIAAFWSDVCGRSMTHAIDREVVTADRVAFVETCVYPDDCKVMASMNLALQDGRIVRHLTVQAWNET
jgi:hypothetical protein